VLFDLRSRGRRRTVQIIYLFLALLMVGGLLLVGVGTGSGGGILNAFTNNGSGNNSGSVVRGIETKARKVAVANPTSAYDWDQLVEDQWSTASQAPDYSSTVGFTAKGKAELTSLVANWTHYLTLTKSPDTSTAEIVSRAYYALGNYAGETNAWQVFANGNPTVAKGFECLAASAYAAKETRVGELAAAQALTLTPKAQRLTLKTSLNAAKTTPTTLNEECFEGA
jgi:hypothetical protein